MSAQTKNTTATAAARQYLTQGIHRALQWDPDSLLTVHGDRERTVRQSVDRVARFAGALHGLGVQKDDCVAVLSLNSDNFTELVLATAWADAMFNLVNTRWSALEVAYALNDSGAVVLVVDEAFVPMLEQLRAEAPGLRHIVYAGENPAPAGVLSYEALIEETSPVQDGLRGGDSIAGIFYTGGTTGFPKGVALSHANLIATATAGAATPGMVQPGGSQLHVAPMFHLADFSTWVMQIVMGGHHISVPVFDIPTIVKTIERRRPTATTLVPAMIQMLVDHPETRQHDLSSLQRVLYGGSPISEVVLRRVMEVLPNAAFIQAYGMTEVSGIATLLLAQEHREGIHLRTGGRAACHSEVRVLDPVGNPLPQGQVGEIAVRCAGVMQGYWNRPEETAQVLRDGWFHTGDAGQLDAEGYLQIVDRLKDMVITGGENVYSAEVENALAAHEAVADVAVVGLPDDRWGERVHAVVVLREGATVDPEELREHVKSRIANYKAPRSFDFVAALPRTATGKIQKHVLRNTASSPDPI